MGTAEIKPPVPVPGSYTHLQNYACEDCGISIEELTPRMFSFNNPFGACPACTGLGSQLKADPALILSLIHI